MVELVSVLRERRREKERGVRRERERGGGGWRYSNSWGVEGGEEGERVTCAIYTISTFIWL